MAFLTVYSPAALPRESDPIFVMQEGRVWMRAPVVTPEIPAWSEVEDRALAKVKPLLIGRLGDENLWGMEIPKEAPAWSATGFEWMEAKALMALFHPDGMQALCAARQLLFWEGRTRFCGSCGTALVDAPRERARKCPACGLTSYPAQTPAVIVSVIKDDLLLLAHNKNFRPGLYSLVAGFVDPGESLEQAVAREVAEETGLQVGEVTYLASQPWPFPNSLMVGFTARYSGGEISVDGVEIEHAAWFTRDALPEIPSRGTIARRLIDTWVVAED